jgi:phosphohistidine phosphatase
VVTKPDYWYIQSAVIPFRKHSGELQILLITSRKKKRWTIPKGIKEPDLSPWQSAAKEALEEAGIAGPVLDHSLGTFTYRKWGGVCTVEVFAMAVEKVLDVWQEDYRDREWVALDEASARLDRQGLSRIVQSLPGFLYKHSTHPLISGRY